MQWLRKQEFAYGLKAAQNMFLYGTCIWGSDTDYLRTPNDQCRCIHHCASAIIHGYSQLHASSKKRSHGKTNYDHIQHITSFFLKESVISDIECRKSSQFNGTFYLVLSFVSKSFRTASIAFLSFSCRCRKISSKVNVSRWSISVFTSDVCFFVVADGFGTALAYCNAWKNE